MTQHIIGIAPTNNARNMATEKETVRSMHLLGLVGGAIRHLAEARFYMARSSDGASPVYCSVWVHAPGVRTSGYGRATGFGYHKESAALDTALQSAGVVLAEDIAGCGREAMDGALLALGEHVGATGLVVI